VVLSDLPAWLGLEAVALDGLGLTKSKPEPWLVALAWLRPRPWLTIKNHDSIGQKGVLLI